MFEVRRTPEFQSWFDGLRDIRAQTRISTRIFRAEAGNLGDVKPVGDGVSEMRIPYGPGYRIYFIVEGRIVILLLCGGDKGTQAKDIARARRMAAIWRS